MRIFDPTDKLGFPHNLRAETKICYLDNLPDYYDIEMHIGDSILYKIDGQERGNHIIKKTVMSVRQLKDQLLEQGQFEIPYMWQGWDENGKMLPAKPWPGIKHGRFGQDNQRDWFKFD